MLDPQGFDAGKKITGRKRHILVDTLGLLLSVAVHPANIQDRDGCGHDHGAPAKAKGKKSAGKAKTEAPAEAKPASKKAKLTPEVDEAPKPAKPLKSEPANKAAAKAAAKNGCWTIEIVERSPTAVGFEVLPKRWIVERTFAWLSRFRRLARDFERYARTVAAFIHLAMIRIMLKRLVASSSS